jgi:hypothetical protein
MVAILVTASACQASEPSPQAGGRERVVELVQAGLLGTPGVDQQSVRLPPEFAGLSDSGEIVITRWNDKLRIVFFTVRGLVDAWEGTYIPPIVALTRIHPAGS